MAPPDQYSRLCSECPNTLPSNRPNVKTCSSKCRSKRSRRLRRTNVANGRARALPPHQAAVAEAVRFETPDIAHLLIQRELGPVVREALTDDVLRSIRTMVGLAPIAVQALADDLLSDDAKTRQKAYDLWLRYTVGHNAIVRAEEAEDSKQLVVHFNLPRPDGGAGSEAQEQEVTEAAELRTCLICAEEKPVSEFVGGSDRCAVCHEELQAKARELLAP